jgi:hypothetical protein
VLQKKCQPQKKKTSAAGTQPEGRGLIFLDMAYPSISCHNPDLISVTIVGHPTENRCGRLHPEYNSRSILLSTKGNYNNLLVVVVVHVDGVR